MSRRSAHPLFAAAAAFIVLTTTGVAAAPAPLINLGEPARPPPVRTEPLLPVGTCIQMPPTIIPRSFAFAPSRNGMILTDWYVPDLPFPGIWKHFGSTIKGDSRAWVFNAQGKLIRRLDFPDKKATPYGIAEDVDGRIALTFHTLGKDAIEVWDSSLDTKLTFHEQSVRPSMPFFDPSGNGVLWLPYTITDRQYEEGEGVLALWAYTRDGGRWEVFPRRELPHTKYNHMSLMDGHRRVWTAGLKEWIWDLYGFYGPMPKTGFQPASTYAHLDVFELVFDKRHPAWIKEARARYNETNPNAFVPEGQAPPGVDFKAALHLVKSYPFPFNCLWTLFDITQDGHVLATCYESDTLVILRVVPQGSDASDGVLLDRPVPVATLRAPYNMTSIVTVKVDPSGKAFTLADKVSRRVVSLPWPLPHMDTAVQMLPDGAAGIKDAASGSGMFGPLHVGALPKLRVVAADF